ncbi:MAG: hypothetical protein Roseis2KO_15760 [Roseivirga sp.]
MSAARSFFSISVLLLPFILSHCSPPPSQSQLDDTIQTIFQAFDQRDTATLRSLDLDWSWKTGDRRSKPQLKKDFGKNIDLDSIERRVQAMHKNFGKRKVLEIFRRFEKYNITLKNKPHSLEKIKRGPDSRHPSFEVSVSTHHWDFQQLVFTLVNYESRLYLKTSTLFLKDASEVGGDEIIDQLKFSRNATNELVLEGSIRLSQSRKPAKEIEGCVMSNSLFLVIDTERSINAQGQPMRTGNWGGFHMTRDKNFKFLGVVTYKFQYSFSEDTFHFSYSDFKHDRKMSALNPEDKSNNVSSFNSLGSLKLKYHNIPKTDITKEQYQNMLKRIKRDIAKFVGLLKNRASGCLAAG